MKYFSHFCFLSRRSRRVKASKNINLIFFLWYTFPSSKVLSVNTSLISKVLKCTHQPSAHIGRTLQCEWDYLAAQRSHLVEHQVRLKYGWKIGGGRFFRVFSGKKEKCLELPDMARKLTPPPTQGENLPLLSLGGGGLMVKCARTRERGPPSVLAEIVSVNISKVPEVPLDLVKHHQSVNMDRKLQWTAFSSKGVLMKSLHSHVHNVNIRNGSLVNDHESEHMDQKIKCVDWAHQLSYKSDLIKHHKSVYMSQRFQCLECKRMTTWKGNLVRHRHTVLMGRTLRWLKCEHQASFKCHLMLVLSN
jgi:hypothetical protein